MYSSLKHKAKALYSNGNKAKALYSSLKCFLESNASALGSFWYPTSTLGSFWYPTSTLEEST
ncbi:MAG: hypothetical protein KAI83_11540 [Thiomargarita sp.]|nr:hypothetical protein [Thiomargarita sp.]